MDSAGVEKCDVKTWTSRYLLATAVAAAVPSLAQAQLRVLTYNVDAADVGTLNSGYETILPAIAAESVNGIARPVDVFSITETISNDNSGPLTSSQTVRQLVNILNNGNRNITTAGPYSQGVLNGATTGGGFDGIIFNTSTVQLMAEAAVGTVDSSSGPARQPMRYQFRPVGYGSSADFYVYVDHYKASSGSSNVARRAAEADMLRKDAGTLPQGSRILYTGDFNLTKAKYHCAPHAKVD